MSRRDVAEARGSADAAGSDYVTYGSADAKGSATSLQKLGGKIIYIYFFLILKCP